MSFGIGSGVIRILRTTVAPTGVAENVLVNSFPCHGWKTVRIHNFSNQASAAGGLALYQKPANLTKGVYAASGAGSYTFRKTDPVTVSASTSADYEFNITGEYVKIGWTPSATAPTVFEILIELHQ